MDQTVITRDEAALARDLRVSAARLMEQTNRLLAATGTAIDALAEALVPVVQAATDDSETSDRENVEAAVALIERVSKISKTNADIAEKCIRIERQVRGEPTDGIAIHSRPIPEDDHEVLDAIRADTAAIERHLSRRG